MADILIVKTGSTDREIVETHGDYDDWFLANLPVRSERIRIVQAYKGETLPDVSGFAGVLLTGSVLSVTDEEEWMLPLGRWAVSAADKGVAVLAVCFGHQLVGEVLGGRVVENPLGVEVGTVDVTLTEKGKRDPLFKGLPFELNVQASHGFVVSKLPPDVELLASNHNTEIQSFAYGNCLRAVQFHPEVTAPIMERLLLVRGYSNTAKESNHGKIILKNWVTHWVDKR